MPDDSGFGIAPSAFDAGYSLSAPSKTLRKSRSMGTQPRLPACKCAWSGADAPQRGPL